MSRPGVPPARRLDAVPVLDLHDGAPRILPALRRPTSARNSSNASPDRRPAASSMNSASSSETPYGSTPSAPAASQNARSSGSLRERETRDQRRATSLFGKPAAASLAATSSMNRARVDSAAARQLLAADLPETQAGVRAGVLVSPRLERRTIELERHVGKGEPRPIVVDRMPPITSAEHRPPIGCEAFGQMDRRDRHVVAGTARRGIEEPARILFRHVQPEATERRSLFRRHVRTRIEPLSRKPHAVRPRRSATPCSPRRSG